AHPMKFLTVLKDSYREAVDGKIFQAMLVLSGLFILFVASISYKPLALDEALAREFGVLNTFFSNNPGVGNPTLSVENFRVTNGATEPWKGDYEFDVVVTSPTKEGLELARKSGLPWTSTNMVKTMMSKGYFYLSNVSVEEVPGASPGQARYRVTT